MLGEGDREAHSDALRRQLEECDAAQGTQVGAKEMWQRFLFGCGAFIMSWASNLLTRQNFGHNIFGTVDYPLALL